MAITKTADNINKSTQEIENLSFNTNFNLKAVQIIGSDGTNAQEIKTDTNGNLTPVVKEVPPTDTTQNNPSIGLVYTGSNLTGITATIGGVTYTKTLTYTGSDLTSISAWV